MKFSIIYLVLIGGTTATASFRPNRLNAQNSDLLKRSCAVRSYGCEKGYCWRKCDEKTGAWCWLAFNGGQGNWVTCKNDVECAINPEKSCASRDKPQGGCSC